MSNEMLKLNKYLTSITDYFNILCNNAYLCKCKVDAKPECRMCKDIETSKHLVYECKNLLLIWR